MKPRLSLLFAALAAALTVSAQQSVALETMQAALRFRAEIAAAVAADPGSAGDALQRLEESDLASGLALERDADLAYAALDIGHRLLAMRRLEAAELFFRAAESGFEQAANRASQAREKARYLQKLAYVRGNYLNKIAQAKADIDEAIRLQPEDKSLDETRRLLARGRSEHFRESRDN